MGNEVAKRQNNQGALLPSSLSGAMDLAKMMADSTLVPTALQKKPADCLLVIEQAMRWGMSPFAVAQCTSVIHGKLMFEGKLVAAVVNANGDLSERLNYSYSGEGQNRTIKVSGKVKSEPEPRCVDVTLKDVKTSNELWNKQPDQQLMYAGARIWARRHMPELMLGVYTPEEDIEDTRPSIDDAVPIATVSTPNEDIHIDPHTIAVGITEDDKNSDWLAWGKTYSEFLRSAKTIEEFEEWIHLNATGMGNIGTGAPHLHSRLLTIIDSERKRLSS
jgi:RecT family